MILLSRVAGPVGREVMAVRAAAMESDYQKHPRQIDVESRKDVDFLTIGI